MAGTTLVTILKEAVSSLTQALRQGVGHIWAPSVKLTKSHLIKMYTRFQIHPNYESKHNKFPKHDNNSFKNGVVFK